MTYRIIIEKKAEKFIRKQEKKEQERLLRAIYQLPDGTDVKKLKGFDLFRLRVGSYRVIYSIDNEIKIIAIKNIDNRGDIYKNL
ncbi:MAG TPA: type II toxin-antitoxin system RelE/ParE family toxin [Candidatus Eisenbergiella pullistercoris]|uniref:Type II toxin-antitoxin system RelE/ParE family toxin n=1 Tax=Candidatus Eisenbergiella pullistercoris TaxID=2838555 RepID=A0A9D2C776_9FIRM|nr:type II toxin-antitoxin system RelE/ParE family toxin [Candidatus Eisenbergiella pullistercoris]